MKNYFKSFVIPLATVFLLFYTLFLIIGCVGVPKRAEINATLWLNNSPIYAQYCESQPALKEFGFYRRLNDKTFEFISFCDPRAANWIAIFKDDFQRLLDKYVPEKNKAEFQKEFETILK